MAAGWCRPQPRFWQPLALWPRGCQDQGSRGKRSETLGHPDTVPQPLIDQLKEGGKLVIPVGDFFQDLLVLTKTPEGVERREIIPVRFVPMIGEVEDQRRR